MSEINCFVDVNKAKLNFMLSMDSEVTWKMFNEEMSKYLSDFDLSRAPRFSYEDEDGDRVFFESDMELKEALNYAAQQDLFIIFVDAAEKEAPVPVPSIPQAIPAPQEVPQNGFNDLSDVVNVIGKALQKDLPQIANVIENVLGDKDSLQNNLNCAAKFISQFCEEEKEDIEKLVEEFLPALCKVPKQKKCKEQKKKKVNKKCKRERVIHNAICDYCSKHIEGIRYKCLQCPDYDLCEACESVNCKNKFHDESHIFAKIVKPLRSPVAPHPHFAARMRGGPCPGQQRFERVKNLEDKVQSLENELAQIKALLLNNNNAPVENSSEAIPAIIPEVSQTEQQQQPEPEPEPEQQPEEPVVQIVDDLLTAEERECFEQLKAMGFDVHSSIVAENNADLSLILEKLL